MLSNEIPTHLDLTVLATCGNETKCPVADECPLLEISIMRVSWSPECSSARSTASQRAINEANILVLPPCTNPLNPLGGEPIARDCSGAESVLAYPLSLR